MKHQCLPEEPSLLLFWSVPICPSLVQLVVTMSLLQASSVIVQPLSQGEANLAECQGPLHAIWAVWEGRSAAVPPGDQPERQSVVDMLGVYCPISIHLPGNWSPVSLLGIISATQPICFQ